jgi:predicted metal-dependent phosphoesterase TrpH
VLIDLHVHTKYSEGFETTLEEVANACQARGINAALLAECDVVPSWDEVTAASKEHGFNFFVGVDVDASDGRVIAVPNDPNNEQFVKMAWRGDDDETTVDDVVRVIQEIGGVVLACHPYLDDGGPFLGDQVYRTQGLAGVEVECGLRKRLPNDLALEAAIGMNLPTLAGSDTGPEGQRLGRFATAFADEVSSQAELIAAIQAGTCWAVRIEESRGGGPRQNRSRGRGGRRRN